METRIILCGLGGQGIVFLTRLLAQAALTLELPVMVSETHGMSQRGGSVMSHLKIGGNQAPLIQMGTADFLFAMDSDEAVRNLPYLREGGAIFANSLAGLRAEVSGTIKRMNFAVHSVAASQIGSLLGIPASANVVLAGFSTAFPESTLPRHSMMESLEKLSKRNLVLNRQAFEAGYREGKKTALIANGSP